MDQLFEPFSKSLKHAQLTFYIKEASVLSRVIILYFHIDLNFYVSRRTDFQNVH